MSIFEQILNSDHQLDGAEPTWLKKQIPPEFTYSEYNAAGASNLLLLHGLLGAVTNWMPSVPYFEKFARTIAFQFPLVTGKRTEVKVKALAAYTEFFIRQMKLNKPLNICGNSLGGHVALRLTLAAPELVSSLVLAGSSGLYEHTIDTLPIRPTREFMRGQMQRVFYNHDFITEEALDEVTDVFKDKSYHLNIIHAARSAKRDYLLERLKDIAVPVLLVWGENDLITTLDIAETFASNLQNAELVVFEQCGHAPMIEYPEKFSAVLQDFLVRHNLD